MAVTTLDVTPGSTTANAYVTLAVANQYHEDRPAVGTTWASATNDQKNAAILWATKLLDALWVWVGWSTDESQALLWPRQGIPTRNGFGNIPNNQIPIELQYACAEYARQLLVGDLAGNSDIETQGIKALTAGPVSLTFKDNVTAKPVPDTVVYLIPREWGYPVSRNGSGVREMVRT